MLPTSPAARRSLGLALSFTPALFLTACASTSDTLLQTSSALEPAAPSAAVAVQDEGLDMDAMMADMIKMGTPGDAHAAMAKNAGKWNIKGLMHMGPGAEGMPMMASAEIEVIFGGRYTIEHFHSDFMGTPFEGMLISGYDNLSERHWNIWMDNMSTRYSAAWGNMNEAGQLEFQGTMHDSMTPDGRPTRTLINIGDDDHVSMKMFDSLPDGTEWVTMEFEYTRAK